MEAALQETCGHLEHHQVEEGEGVAQDRRTLASAEEVVGAEERAFWWYCSLD